MMSYCSVARACVCFFRIIILIICTEFFIATEKNKFAIFNLYGHLLVRFGENSSIMFIYNTHPFELIALHSQCILLTLFFLWIIKFMCWKRSKARAALVNDEIHSK